MLVIQSGFKTDLETDRSIFILYMNNGNLTYNCSIDYNIINNDPTSDQVFNAVLPMLRSLCNSVFKNPEAEKPLLDQNEPKPAEPLNQHCSD